ncbi:MAG: isoprenylcysteine carboxylmethyltransferase family protein [archaeon]|nr:isoprenylcysteine carboxylmethyltransferase family protein [archaeon]
MMWPIIPVLLIPIHLSPKFWRKIGILTYPFLLAFLLPIAYLIVLSQDFLLEIVIEFPMLIFLLGLVLITIGVIIHGWTAKLLGIKSLIGYPEIRPDNEKGKLITSSLFSIVRHPTYLAHALLWLGFFLLMGFLSLGLLTLLDFLLSYYIIIPLEERELVQRFGQEYIDYKKRVPKFFPRFFGG